MTQAKERSTPSGSDASEISARADANRLVLKSATLRMTWMKDQAVTELRPTIPRKGNPLRYDNDSNHGSTHAYAGDDGTHNVERSTQDV
ncbi:MAG: hypothetical protein E5Y18_16915 [Mesorhizobium sp.]|nr:MAG: hypothetical protein E5Y18_16915 [Mesorhizobium sp.]